MELKAKVRKRRQDRIREIQSRELPDFDSGVGPLRRTDDFLYARADRHESGGGDRLGSGGASHYRLPGQGLPFAVWDKRSEDPEYVWKMKEKMLFEEARGRSSYPSRRDTGEDDGPRRRIGWRLMLSAILFFVVLVSFKLPVPGSNEAHLYVQKALTQEWNFSRASAWYEQTFGSLPSFLPAFGDHTGETAAVSGKTLKTFNTPVRGTVAAPYTPDHRFVILQTEAGLNVSAMESGRVLFAGNREQTGNTIVIQHAGGLQTTYGQLQQVKWERNDWIQSGETVGTVAKDSASGRGSLYFAVMKDKDYVNPADVVKFD